ncbi:MAG TPA: S41 family peptidase, partial [Thermoanaerobaculia bacterium]|nr:S41 family peptidase [Thermoanaerobaculia bacterium]
GAGLLHMVRLLAALGVASLFVMAPVAAQQVVAQETRVEWFAKLADLWADVKYFHPHMLMRPVDWDGALLRAIPAVRDAQTHRQFVDAVGAMLAELGDSATRVVEAPAEFVAPKVPLLRTDGDVLIVNLGPHATPGGDLWTSSTRVTAEIAKAERVVIDLRMPAGGGEGLDYALRQAGLNATVMPVPPSLVAMHSGYAPQDGMPAGYYSALQLIPAVPLQLPQWKAPRAPSRIVFVTDGRNFPEAAAAVWWSGKAAIVSEVPLTGDALAGTRSFDLGDGWSATYRISQLAANGLSADAIVSRDAAMAKAIELARGNEPFAARPAMEAVPVLPRGIMDEKYAAMLNPDLPHRMLALFRLWSVIDRFFPYKHLMSSDWSEVLRTMIPRFEAANGEQEYAAAVLETVAFLDDGHATAFGHPAIHKVLGGNAIPQFTLRLVRGQYVITETRVDTVNVGDVVIAADGEPLRDRVQRLWKYTTASTEVARTNRILGGVLRGAVDTEVVLTLQNDDPSTRDVRVKRGRYIPPVEKSEPTFRVLDGNIGYVDMPRLMPTEVDPMFEALAKTKAIIFDMRGYPKGTAWQIAPRINIKKARYGASFRRPQLTARSAEETSGGFYFDQPLPPNVGNKPQYTGPTATLIDDSAISHAEHSALFFEAANGTTFIGTPTAGANGDVTSLNLPGGFRVMFTGHDVRHADGRQLQRIGIVPHIVAEPTVQGLREGKDEVLERALVWANEITRK